jgi:hypothetical protein
MGLKQTKSGQSNMSPLRMGQTDRSFVLRYAEEHLVSSVFRWGCMVVNSGRFSRSILATLATSIS